MRGYRALLGNRNFLFLYLGLLISRFGDGIAKIVITWTVWSETTSPSMVALSMILSVLPPILFSFLAGVAADRHVHRTLMALSDITRLLAALGAAVLAWMGGLEAWHLMLLSFLLGTFGTFFGPARAAAMPHIIDPSKVQAANGLMAGSFHGALLIGPLFGGWLLNLTSPGTLLFVDAMTFAASLLGVMLLPSTVSSTRRQRRSMFTDAREGLKTVIKVPALFWIIATFAIGVFLSGGVGEVGRTLLMDLLGSGPEGLGMVSTSMGIGIMLGSLWVGRVVSSKKARLVMLSWAVNGLIAIVMGLSNSLSTVLVVAFIGGINVAFINVPTEALIQVHGGENTGKVYSYWNIVIQAGQLASLATFAPLFEVWTVPFVFSVSGVGLIIMALVGARFCWSLQDGAPAEAGVATSQ